MNWLEFALRHADEPCTVVVSAVKGTRGYADPVPVGPCVIADGVVFCPPDTVAPPGSLVTLPGGDAARVVDVHYLHPQGTRLPEHLQLDVSRRVAETPPAAPATRARSCRSVRRSVSPRR